MASNQLIGIGLRHPHYKQVIEERPAVDWFEVHSENFYFADSNPALLLNEIRKHYPISLHGIGLSLGSADGLDQTHLSRLRDLIARIDPFLVSEHVSWNSINGIHLPDLLPVPYNRETLAIMASNIAMAQDYLRREILIENPSSYIEYSASDQSEVEFIVELCQQSGARLLLDVNNVFVSCSNHGWNAIQYIQNIPKTLVKEIHLAGHSFRNLDTNTVIRVDTHDDFVCDEVWNLYELALQRFGLVPTLLEWDGNIPELKVLVNEAHKALKYTQTSAKVLEYA